MRKYVDTQDAASYLGIPETQLREWQSVSSAGPEFSVAGDGCVVYLMRNLIQYKFDKLEHDLRCTFVPDANAGDNNA